MSHLIKFLSLALIISVLGCASTSAQQDASPPERYYTWLADLKKEALSKGIREETLELALRDITPLKRVIELDQRQPEFRQTFWQYLDARVNEKRVEKGREMLRKHRKLLRQIEKEHKVQARFLVSFWGMETNYGKYFGSFPVIQALVTLAFDERRSQFFRAQLLAALRIIDAGDMPPDVPGSWAGAMGHTQFLPTTYLKHAVDADGDGKRDLWNSLPDVFASSANFLSSKGWDHEHTWGRMIRLPKNFDYALANLGTKKKLAEWNRLGVRRMNGNGLPRVDIEGAIVLPAGHKGPAFLVYQNFETTLVWNRSIAYAIAVGHLSDRIVGRGPYKVRRNDDEKPLSRDEVMEIQTLLTDLGYEPGGIDGIPGSGTRSAVRAFQKQTKLPADGYPDHDLLTRLRNAAKGTAGKPGTGSQDDVAKQ